MNYIAITPCIPSIASPIMTSPIMTSPITTSPIMTSNIMLSHYDIQYLILDLIGPHKENLCVGQRGKITALTLVHFSHNSLSTPITPNLVSHEFSIKLSLFLIKHIPSNTSREIRRNLIG